MVAASSKVKVGQAAAGRPVGITEFAGGIIFQDDAFITVSWSTLATAANEWFTRPPACREGVRRSVAFYNFRRSKGQPNEFPRCPNHHMRAKVRNSTQSVLEKEEKPVPEKRQIK